MLDPSRCIVAFLAAALRDTSPEQGMPSGNAVLDRLGWSGWAEDAAPSPSMLYGSDDPGDDLASAWSAIERVDTPSGMALVALALGILHATGRPSLAAAMLAVPARAAVPIRDVLAATGWSDAYTGEWLMSPRVAAMWRCRSCLRAGHAPLDPFTLRHAIIGVNLPSRPDAELPLVETSDWREDFRQRIGSADASTLLHAHSATGSAEGELVRALEWRAGVDLPTAAERMEYAATIGLFDREETAGDPTASPFLGVHHWVRHAARVRRADTRDLPRLLDLEARCWDHTRSDETTLARRIQEHPAGQFVIELDGQVAGVVYSQRIDGPDALAGHSAHTVHALHRTDARFVQLLAINVDPRWQDQRLGDHLLEFLLRLATVMEDVDGVLGVTLCKRFDAGRDESFDAYIRRDREGQDPVLAFHQAHGADIVRAVPGYRPEDRQNQAHGVLVSYDLGNRLRRIALPAVVTAGPLRGASAEAVARWLRERVVALLNEAESGYAADRPLMEMGIDSAGLLTLQRELEEALGSALPGAFFFEYNTVSRVAAQLGERSAHAAVAVPNNGTSPIATPEVQHAGDIAVIGVACRLPGGVDSPAALWRVLDSGDCVVGSYPSSRGRWASATDYPGIDRGGFVGDLEAFDAAFFRISPAEAQLMDPQQRLVLELAWHAIEDAGVSPRSLAGGATGVFVGASNADYSRMLQERGAEIEAHLGVASSLAVIANRVSYFLDLAGPSLLIDTACSSSLVALHTAVQSLRRGECTDALVAGVNVICHPDLSVAYHKAGMLSPDGLCKVFDARADGYVRAEGAVALYLKPLADALAAGDPVQGVIRGSAINHGGLASGITVPNPRKQRDLLLAAWRDAGVDPSSFGYLEAHGTGTSLGDPIEVEAIMGARAAATVPAAGEPCGIGSIKSQFGHLESAAGLAGVLKVLLALRHDRVPATTQFHTLNPRIRLDPGVVVQAASGPWPRHPHIAGVSSFGSGGANAHVVIAGHTAGADRDQSGPHLFVLSAATSERLRAYTQRVAGWLDTDGHDISFAAAIRTWQNGRAALRHRLAVRVDCRDALRAKLGLWLDGGTPDDFWLGGEDAAEATLALWRTQTARELLAAAARKGDIDQLAALWTRGVDVDWRALHTAGPARRVAGLPAYPFARERHWIDGVARADTPRAARLHPMLHANVSDLSRTAFSSVFDGSEPFLDDHKVRLGDRDEAVMPAVGYVEMMCAALERATPPDQHREGIVLRHVAWMAPLVVRGDVLAHTTLVADDDEDVRCEIASGEGTRRTPHGVGRLAWSRDDAPQPVDLQALRARLVGPVDGRVLYTELSRMGLVYGPSHRALTALRHGRDEVLAELRLPDHLHADAEAFILHPSLADAALQACIGLLGADRAEPRLPFSVDEAWIRRGGVASLPTWAWIRRVATDRERIDIDLCTDDGTVVMAWRGFSTRSVMRDDGDGLLLARADWAGVTQAPLTLDWSRRHRFTINGRAWPDAATLDAPAGNFGDLVRACLSTIQHLLKARDPAACLFQLALPDDGDLATWTGVAALLRSVSREQPRFHAQLLVAPSSVDGDAFSQWADEMAAHPGLRLLRRREDGRTETPTWQVLDQVSDPVPYREHGVYLITGGLGRIGCLLAADILSTAGHARVVLSGRTEPDGERATQLAALRARFGDRIVYRAMDLSRRGDVERIVGDLVAREGALNGVFHAAGTIRDAFVIGKRLDDVDTVLAPKVRGTQVLDEALAASPLDFFVLFSSTAAAFGHVGQADYAAANGFMDGFAAARNARVREGIRHGHTVSIAWPLWKDGGMRMEDTARREWQKLTGMKPLGTADAMRALRVLLSQGVGHGMAMAGRMQAMRRALESLDVADEAALPRPGTVATPVPVDLRPTVEQWLRGEFSRVLKLPIDRVGSGAAFDTFGIDSILAMGLTTALEKVVGSLPKTLFFEYRNLGELAGYLIDAHADVLARTLATTHAFARAAAPVVAKKPAPAAPKHQALSSSAPARGRAAATAEPIAIVGLSGRYPGSPDLATFWTNLRDGRDCVIEVPAERWNWREHYSEDRDAAGRHYSRWGGFVEGVDEFDPQFFHIAPREARYIDPQERMFLQHAWMAVEDAGYTRASLHGQGEQAGQVGVYVGVMWSEYQLFGVTAPAASMRMGFAGNVASIANRVSYVLDLHGPSMTVDTMCSSSLTAIHLACQDLRAGTTRMAIAGGVNLTVHPQKYLMLSAGQFISGDGHCQSFGEGGDGYIPGEGVGAVVLKRLADAERDGDTIHGVIRGSALNHGGRTNGYTVPNPQAQAAAIGRALGEAGVDARHVSYVEAHGTGTRLGDPIEIAALSRAFGQYTGDRQFCLIGSAKSNIGHAEAAAGIAGLTKLLLQMRHGQIVPSLHSARLNPHIDFAAGPFTVNQTLREWEAPVVDGRRLPRVAGLSSFGAGGSNAHMIVEEYVAAVPAASAMSSGPVVIVLSARTPVALRQQAQGLVAYLGDTPAPLASVAWTLQGGREAMNERLAVVAADGATAIAGLEAFLAGSEGHEGLYVGQAQQHRETMAWFSEDAELREAVSRWAASGRLDRVAQAWTRGVDIPWAALHDHRVPAKASLPTYPFARERYWLDLPAASTTGPATARLHPLLHENVSDLGRQAFRSYFSGNETFLRAHRLRRDGMSHPLMPAAAWLEMAREAIERSMPNDARQGDARVMLEDVAWPSPCFVDAATAIDTELTLDDDDHVRIDMATVGDGEMVVHARMRGRLTTAPLADVDLAGIEARATGHLHADALYARFDAMGMIYGPEHRTVQGVALAHDEVLVRLAAAAPSDAGVVVAPALLDGAFQACLALLDETTAVAWLPFALDRLVVASPCVGDLFAWVRVASCDADGGMHRFDIDMTDRTGRPCLRIEGLAVRPVVVASANDDVLAFEAQWQAIEAAVSTDAYPECWFAVGASAEQRDAMIHTLAGSGITWIDGATRGDEAAFLAAWLPRVQALVGEAKPPRLRVACFAGVDAACLHALAALLATAGQECHALSPCLIDAQYDASASGGHVAQVLTGARAGDTFVRVDADGRISRRTWVERTVAEAAPTWVRPGGVYLITGGRGGIGGVLRRYLVDHGARVVVSGRAPADPGTDAHGVGLVDDEGVTYRQLDLGDANAVEALVQRILADEGRLDGVLHLAGSHDDAPLGDKTGASFAASLAPKVTGSMHLDRATREVPLDVFVVFSSVAGAFGNAGQIDYATANGYLDGFARTRAERAAAGERHGRSLSIGWPLWADGGMRPDEAQWRRIARATGMRPLSSEAALDALQAALGSDAPHRVVLSGDAASLRRTVAAQTSPVALPAVATPAEAATRANAAARPAEANAPSEQERAETFLRERLAGTLKLPATSIDPRAPFEDYGLDSILAVRLAAELETTFGTLSKTLFYEHRNLRDLSAYLLALKPEAFPADTTPTPSHLSAPPTSRSVPTLARHARRRHIAVAPDREREVAIVGLAGRYPLADDLAAFWDNLRQGRDCVTDVPAERWDVSRYLGEPGQPGTSYSTWGGFLDGIDRFDPLFFGIAPREAALLDPQERLFLETAWQAVEDAGYGKAALAGSQTGVFVGVMWGQYELYGAEAIAAGQGVPSSSFASIANRVSYLLDLRGPSMAVDTMCSSSLTAIHLASEEIRRGTIDAAIAGGVNVSVHPHKYLTLSQGRFAATDGRCRSFGNGGDGYVPGEGVGAVYLKPLDHALRDGDHVYGIVRSSALNHGGKTSGYTVPNPNAQAALIAAAFARGGVAADSVSYIEAHGTGTALGDPIEINGLARAFVARGGTTGACAIGSVKSNIGHLESAAGIAAVTKVLLQLRHGELVPSLHAGLPNPNIAFDATPFRVQHDLAPWPTHAGAPRRAGVSSFGAGGANAHVVIEEWRDPRVRSASTAPVALLLSARDPVALTEMARRLAAQLEGTSPDMLADVAFTLQVGRTPMDARLGLVATDPHEAAMRLRHWADRQSLPTGALVGLPDEGVVVGSASQVPPYAQRLVDGEVGRNFIAQLAACGDLARMMHLWALGIDLDWQALHEGRQRHRLSLPTYPFQRQRCWIGASTPSVSVPVPSPPVVPAAPAHMALRWMATPVPAAAPGGAIPSWLAIEAGDAVTAALRDRSRVPVIHLPFGSSSSGRDTASRDAEDIDGYRRLFSATASGQPVPRHMLWCANSDPAQPIAMLHLFRAALEAHHAFTFVLVMNDEPAQQALAALLHTLALEQPRVRVVAVSVAIDAAHADIAAFALAEAGAHAGPAGAEVRYVRTSPDAVWQREVRVAEVALGLPEARAPMPIRHRGSYLVTGGLGGLGRIVATELLRRYDARVILAGRSPLDDAGRDVLAELAASGGEIDYVSVDIADTVATARLVDHIRTRFGELHGVFHAAGVHRDGAILHKDAATFREVIRAKVDGTIALDEATQGRPLDLFVLFSSLAGVAGNAGQSDYAYANRFLDAFAAARAARCARGERHGRSLSIAWPLWEQGGMRIDAGQAERLHRSTGMRPMPTAVGLRHLDACLAGVGTLAIPLYGDPTRLVRPVDTMAAVETRACLPTTGASLDLLRELVGSEIGADPATLGEQDRFDALGLDSIAIGRLNAALRDRVGELSTAFFYEHETLGAAALVIDQRMPAVPVMRLPEAPVADSPPLPIPPTCAAQEKIAIVGIHGRFPGGADLDAFWHLLAEARDAVRTVPVSRWDADAWHGEGPDAAARGRIHCRVGAFIDDVDHFDAAFFRIPAEEAAVMDPQERLFVESVWHAMEDAGFTRQGLRKKHPRGGGADVGVFVGTTTQSHALLAGEARRDGVMDAPASLPWSIANRVSYLFDFRGPSLPVDTACSSALVGLHMACESLRRDECAVAVAGAVNLYLHPLKYLSLAQRGMLASHGATRSFGEGDDGFVPGEGVGALVLKRLDRALADGDRIHGVIAASGFEHAGRGNGYSAPNPNAQAALIRRVLAAGGIDADSIDCIEGHGTGTPMGDEVELRALDQVFGRPERRLAPASLGSVKGNIGHLESAAGLSGVAKVLLQIRHERLVPTLHARRDLAPAGGAIRLQHGIDGWPASPDRARRALVNAFGAGGVNACVVIEDAPVVDTAMPAVTGDACLFVLSALDLDRLRVHAARFAAWLPDTAAPLVQICTTLQRGREAMPARLALRGHTATEIASELNAWLAGDASRVRSALVDRRAVAAAGAAAADAQADDATLTAWLAGREPAWDIPPVPPPMGMPGYPFAPTRHWIASSLPMPTEPMARPAPRTEERLHPWVSYNASTLREIGFDSWLTPASMEVLARLSGGRPVLPPAALLEIGVACGTLAGEQRVVGIRDVRFDQPLVFHEDIHRIRTVLERSEAGIHFRIGGEPTDEGERPLAEGTLLAGRPQRPDHLARQDIADLRSRSHPVDARDLVMRLGAHGQHPRSPGIRDLHMCGAFALARLAPDAADDAFIDRFMLKPHLLAGLFDLALAWLDRDMPGDTFHLTGFDELSVWRGLPPSCLALVQWSAKWPGRRLDATLLDEQGEPIASLRGLTLATSPQADDRCDRTNPHDSDKERADVRNHGLA